MRAREVSPQEAPELHGMIDRLCAMADMPKPRVGIADMAIPNAFATGRSPDRSVVCVTTGILRTLTAEELEGVLAHELSHVAHRDVLVMTVASSAGIVVAAWLIAGSLGPEPYHLLLAVLRSWIGMALLFAWTFCTFFHLCNGIRHLFWDAGQGFELRSIYLSGWSVVIASTVLTVATWLAGALMSGGAG